MFHKCAFVYFITKLTPSLRPLTQHNSLIMASNTTTAKIQEVSKDLLQKNKALVKSIDLVSLYQQVNQSCSNVFMTFVFCCILVTVLMSFKNCAKEKAHGIAPGHSCVCVIGAQLLGVLTCSYLIVCTIEFGLSPLFDAILLTPSLLILYVTVHALVVHYAIIWTIVILLTLAAAFVYIIRLAVVSAGIFGNC